MKIKDTKSLCPECLKIIPAEIFERDGKVWISKNCPEHGDFEELYWGDYEMYKKATKFAHDGKGISNPNSHGDKECPMNCGLCKNHKSHTALGNIVVTNRCDLQCFYCFFYAKAMGYVYEPTLDQIRLMLRSMRQEKPVPCNAIQLTGGEPTAREDILDIIKMAKDEGYDHVQLNTNGINISKNLEFAKKVKEAGVNTLYLSFDGTTEKTNPKNHWEIPNILDNCRKADIGVVLVPTVINTVNDHDVGNILKFGIKNIDIVRAVNFQPVSLVGKIAKADRKKFRITIPDVIKNLEEQTNGMVTKDDFYPVPTVAPFTHFVEALLKKPQYELSTHPACGMATYIFLDGDKVIPLPRFVDIEGIMAYLNEKADELNKGGNRVITSMKVMSKIGSFIDKEKQPKGLDLKNILFNALVKHDYKALGVFHHKSMLIGMMHFQDLYNYDIERVERCCVHYAQPDGSIIPFCTFNVIPQKYRDQIQEKFSSSIPDWEKKTGKKLEDDLYKREVKN
jgi:7,8-dihydro-6-hydroxymethylpterin dimethyltransferase